MDKLLHEANLEWIYITNKRLLQLSDVLKEEDWMPNIHGMIEQILAEYQLSEKNEKRR